MECTLQLPRCCIFYFSIQSQSDYTNECFVSWFVEWGIIFCWLSSQFQVPGNYRIRMPARLSEDASPARKKAKKGEDGEVIEVPHSISYLLK